MAVPEHIFFTPCIWIFLLIGNLFDGFRFLLFELIVQFADIPIKPFKFVFVFVKSIKYDNYLPLGGISFIPERASFNSECIIVIFDLS